MNLNTLQRLQCWYRDQCHDRWEHSYGIKIGTLDNPGWVVTIDLVGTALESVRFTKVDDLAHDTDWVTCEVKGGQFVGHGGPAQLFKILDLFLAWASDNGWNPS